MEELLVATGLVLVIEGLIWALLPRMGKSLAAAALQTPEQGLRIGGTVAVAAGVLIVWLAKG